MVSMSSGLPFDQIGLANVVADAVREVSLESNLSRYNLQTSQYTLQLWPWMIIEVRLINELYNCEAALLEKVIDLKGHEHSHHLACSEVNVRENLPAARVPEVPPTFET